LIVSLLDLNPTVPDPSELAQERLEIFEAGTGHGALTLHLARAIHGANTAAPKILEGNEGTETSPDRIETQRVAYKEWRENRRAIIHTLDCSGRHSAHAETVVKNFRRGMYYPHIDFHVGNIEDYLCSRLVETGDAPFLDHAILDLPDIHHYFGIVGKSLKPNGILITFCPSITQINTGVTSARQKGLPLFLEKVVEVGGAVGVGGREWDVRPVKPRALLKSKVKNVKSSEHLEEDEDVLKDPMEGSKAAASAEAPVSETPFSDGNGWEMVCRPKVGLRISGGGFVGAWRKMTDTSV
jgi:tRNA (adenine57-N1/adenine58-N1)-methyltransferase catalytic subunit